MSRFGVTASLTLWWAYNSLVVSWPEISWLAAEVTARGPVQGRMEL